MHYADINAETVDRWVENGWEWGKPISHETYVQALAGDWKVYLTPTVPVPREWFGELKGKKLLGLASGGAQQMPIFAAAGAECTVLDYSKRQLESEKVFSEREGYPMEIIRADMTQRLPFEDEVFDIIFHPVSNCYVRDTLHVFKECYRVLKQGGVLLSGLDMGINFMVAPEDERTIVHRMPYDPLLHAEQLAELQRDDGGMQFSHTVEDQIGNQLKAGLRLVDVYEDTNGQGFLHEMGIKTFAATKSIKE